MEKFLVLRTRALQTAGFRPFARAAGADAEFTLDTSWATANDVRDMARDPEVQAFAPVMHFTLHEPLPSNVIPASAGEVTWGVRAVGAYDCPFTGAGISLAVLDTGIDSGHPAFAGHQIVEKDFTGSGNGDGHGHGTHCAGTICGKSLNNVRFGVAPSISRLLIGKVLDAGGGGLVAWSGTSMATPHVAGVAALWAEKLLNQTGGINFAALTAKLLGSGTTAGFVEPIDHAAVGTGLVQAPRS